VQGRTESPWAGWRAKFFAGSDREYPFQSIGVRSVSQGPSPGGFAATLMQVDVGPDRSAWVISALTGGFAAMLMQVIAAGVLVRVPATIGSEVPCHVDASGGRQRYREAIDWRLPGGFAATLMRMVAAGMTVGL
jgi:hypothetical protein